jgi:hypothetical protein
MTPLVHRTHRRFLGRALAGIAWALAMTTHPLEAVEPGPTTEFDAAGPRLYAHLGPDDVAYRGWPLLVNFVAPSHEKAAGPSELLVTAEGSAASRLQAVRPGMWWLSAEQTRALPVGECVLTAGTAQLTITLANPPEELDAALKARRHAAIIGFAIAQKDLDGARREAEAWRAAAGQNDELAQVALGDVAMAAEDYIGAHAAYQVAIKRFGDAHEALPIHRKARVALSRALESLATDAPETPPPAVASSTVAAPRSAAAIEQWAITARASSEYRATDYSASQATGAPNVARHGDNAKAWAPKLADGGEEWIELTFAQAVRATEVRVVQSFNPGAIVRIEVIDESDRASVVWTGPDKSAYAKNEIGTLVAKFPVTEKPIARVKLVLDAKSVAGWNEIDAVQLIAGPATP